MLKANLIIPQNFINGLEVAYFRAECESKTEEVVTRDIFQHIDLKQKEFHAIYAGTDLKYIQIAVEAAKQLFLNEYLEPDLEGIRITKEDIYYAAIRWFGYQDEQIFIAMEEEDIAMLNTYGFVEV